MLRLRDDPLQTGTRLASMPQLFAGPTTEFIRHSEQNRIAETLRAAFFEQFGFNPSPSEQRSWRNSLRALEGAVRMGGFTDHGLLLEYQLPLSSRRLDAMITGGTPREGDRAGEPSAVIVELKQWDEVEASEVPECVGVRYGGRIRDVLHPSAQVGQYRGYLADVHTGFHPAPEGGGVHLDACSYLHDFLHDPGSELLSDRHASLLGSYPLFAGDRVDDLVGFLDRRVGGGSGLRILRTIREGRYQPHKRLLDHTAEMIRGEPVYHLLDEQRVVFNSIQARVAHAREVGQKSVFVVRGGPGTGKSVIALNLLADMLEAGYLAHHATGSAAFTKTLRKILGPRAAEFFRYFNSYMNADGEELDILICDEAHRIRKHSWNRFTRKKARDAARPQIDELLTVSRVSVFFLDDLQSVRRTEIGRSNDIHDAAEKVGARVFEYDLETQFRCGGSDGFLRWIENTLQLRRTANALWTGDDNFDFRIVDSPEALDRAIRGRLAAGHGARMVAGYCWLWSRPERDGTLVPDVTLGAWSRPWNAKPDAGRLAPGIPQSHLWASEAGGEDQVGCIYTAQGFEFDYVGVIFGNDLVYDPAERRWVGHPKRSHDRGLKSGTSPEAFTELVKNTYRVLLTRGLKGCFVYFMDPATRTFFESRMDFQALTERDEYPAIDPGFGMRLAAEEDGA
jgi:uncharacterized protein